MARPVLRATQYSTASTQRLIDAEKLCDRQRWTATIYLAGYGAECALKAEVADELRKMGGWLQNEDHPLFKAMWTHDLSVIAATLAHPPDLTRDVVALAKTWSVELRYRAKSHARGEAEDALALARTIARSVQLRLLA